jgi:hypothetical protein
MFQNMLDQLTVQKTIGKEAAALALAPRKNKNINQWSEAAKHHVPTIILPGSDNPIPDPKWVHYIDAIVRPTIAKHEPLRQRWTDLDDFQRAIYLLDWCQTVHISRTILQATPQQQAHDLILTICHRRLNFGWTSLPRDTTNHIRQAWTKALTH